MKRKVLGLLGGQSGRHGDSYVRGTGSRLTAPMVLGSVSQEPSVRSGCSEEGLLGCSRKALAGRRGLSLVLQDQGGSGEEQAGKAL